MRSSRGGILVVLPGLWVSGLSWAAVPHIGEDGETGSPFHLRLDTNATWGIGGQMFLGLQAHGVGYVGLWNTRQATGSLDLGVEVLYDNEATFLAPWIATDQVKGATHRVQLLGTVGHTFHMGGRRQVGLGLHAFAGWNHWRSAYTVTYAEEDVEGSATVTDDRFVGGGQVDLSYRFSRHVGVNLSLMALLPTESSYAITFGRLGLGLAFYLR